MMFLLDLALVVELIAIGFGVCITIWAYRHEGAGVTAAAAFGYMIAIAATLILFCTTYYGTRYWLDGQFTSPLAAVRY